MIDSKNNNLDDEFRVLGRSSSRLPNQGGKPSRVRLCITIIAAIILLTIGIYGIIKWPNRALDSHNKGSAISIESTQ
jgi:hypothetical protein